MASLWERYVVPPLINCACGARPIARQRAKVVPSAGGRVLELGMGGGLNLPFYDAARLSALEAVEPSEPLRRKAQAAASTAGMPANIADGRAEALPFEAASFDCVVCTFTLCSVQDPAAALAEARRVLKPKGRLIFCEHGLAPDAEVVKWQRRIEPVWKRLAGGCHLTRPVAPAIQAAGFRLARLETMYLPGTPRWAGWNEWGEATPA
ncbi:MAG TPA: class I SAM-dependent methyltransferase [Caulobacteraceae bacterium]|jgi:ubiquinone/menaquinone biosynthesis C-methylase UbiE